MEGFISNKHVVADMLIMWARQIEYKEALLIVQLRLAPVDGM